MFIEIGLPTLNEEIIEQLCTKADSEIQKFIFSKISKSKVSKLENIIEINYENNICQIEIEMEIEIPSLDKLEVEKIMNDAIKAAFDAIEKELRK
ncbi:MAG: DUF3194 domain-containing protein [Candidatus Helarchaeota archaeon]